MPETNTTKPAADLVNLDIVEIVNDMNRGQSLAELSEAMVTLIKAVRTTGRPGSLRYTIEVRPAVKGADVEQVFLEDNISTKLPTLQRPAALFFATRANTLTRNNPNQLDMFDPTK